MRWFAPLLGALFIVGCGEEKKDPPNLPAIEGSPLAQCRKIEGVYKLDKVEVTVRDLDGAEDLGTPSVFVESEALTLTKSTAAGGEECKKDACDAVYAWEHGRDSEQIYCGEEGDLLIVDFSVKDAKGYIAEASIKAVPL